MRYMPINGFDGQQQQPEDENALALRRMFGQQPHPEQQQPYPQPQPAAQPAHMMQPQGGLFPEYAQPAAPQQQKGGDEDSLGGMVKGAKDFGKSILSGGKEIASLIGA